MRRRLAIAVLIAAVVLWRARGTTTSPSGAPFFESHIRDDVIVVEGEGVLEPEQEQEVAVSDQAGASQIEWLIDEGTRVKKGDELVHLSTFTIDDRLRGARQELAQKEAELQRQERDDAVTAAEDQKKVEDTRADLEYHRRLLAYLTAGADPREIQSLSLKIESARLQEADLLKKSRVQASLESRGYASELDSAQVSTTLAKARLERAKEENLLSLKREGPRPEEIEKSKAQCLKLEKDLDLAEKTARSQDAIRKLGLDKIRAEIQNKQATLDEKTRQRAHAVLRAPIDGVVLFALNNWGGPITVGSVLWRGRIPMRIIQEGRLKASIRINERWADRLQVGQPARVHAAHQAESFPAVVASISRLASQRDDDPRSPRDFSVELKIGADSPRMRPKMSCRGIIEVARHKAVSRIPIDVIAHRNAKDVDLVALRAGVAVPMKVTVVDEDGDYVDVTGLADPERLLFP